MAHFSKLNGRKINIKIDGERKTYKVADASRWDLWYPGETPNIRTNMIFYLDKPDGATEKVIVRYGLLDRIPFIGKKITEYHIKKTLRDEHNI